MKCESTITNRISIGTRESIALYATAPASSNPWLALNALSVPRRNAPGRLITRLAATLLGCALRDGHRVRRRLHPLHHEDQGEQRETDGVGNEPRLDEEKRRGEQRQPFPHTRLPDQPSLRRCGEAHHADRR